jgi:hypothetical protein
MRYHLGVSGRKSLGQFFSTIHVYHGRDIATEFADVAKRGCVLRRSRDKHLDGSSLRIFRTFRSYMDSDHDY